MLYNHKFLDSFKAVYAKNSLNHGRDFINSMKGTVIGKLVPLGSNLASAVVARD